MINKKKYEIIKVLNNNVILALEPKKRQEMILVGKGIGFGRKDKTVISLSNDDLEKSFIAYDEKTKNQYFQLIDQIDSKVMGISEEIIAEAEEALGKLNSHIHIVLTDHIGFALDRIKMGMEISNPFIYEIKTLYDEEFRVGIKAAELIRDSLQIDICEDEIGFIALHLHSARQNKKITETVKNTRLLKELIQIIQDELSITLDIKDSMYIRLINHLKLVINRLEEKSYIDNPLLGDIKKQFSESFNIAYKIGAHISNIKNITVPDNELGYMTIHIEKLRNEKEKVSKRVTV
ncbi:PRD domain-containing protein [Alkaliphilus peptidifermentans]|uniref:Transcriptional antiterminator, BglG family n=1 Tax=Alkaliphilus peptidifermentans DSM 18978 TaxID=1120976 RepID=A0A1G5BKB3_9FIRM|nr:PRD domain-containing protein [Alkaliphilus peptidifermentans]SCX90639.1 transcriptional antiterminator, BglG family [Alkaliphilus peptidifermentans DSM 18978]